jgi:hypothetical protein
MKNALLNLEDQDNYSFRTIRDGIEPTVCVINGFMSESGSNVDDWLSIADVLYPHNKVIHFDWPAGNMKNMLLNEGVSFVDESGMVAKLGVAGRLAKSHPVSVAASVVLDKVAGRWQQSLKNAEKAGEYLASYIDNSCSSFVLMGHSLGARVSYYSLDNLTRSGSVESAVLFGGAITHVGNWQEILNRHPSLWVCNNYSHNDSVLKFLYKAGTLFTNRPIGLERIAAEHPHLYNFNTSEYVSGHTAYKTQTVGNFLAWKFSEIQELESLTKQFVINAHELDKLQNKAFDNNQEFSNKIDSLSSEQQRSLDAINKI